MLRLPMLRALVAFSLVVASAADDDSAYIADDADAYLESVGVPQGLPLLSVRYKVGSWGKKVLIEGGKTETLKVPKDAEAKPLITWDKSENAETGHTERYVLLMFGPDEPVRASADGASAGEHGPVLYWFLLNCEDSATSCYEGMPYQAPNPQKATGDHRYIFLLFRQQANKVPPMDKISEYMNAPRDHWPLKSFVSSLEASLEPVAVTWFYGSYEGPQDAIEGGGSASGDAPKAKVAAASDSPPPPKASPLGPGWDRAKKPAHDDEHDEL